MESRAEGRQVRGIGWFELIACCLITLALGYGLALYEAKRSERAVLGAVVRQGKVLVVDDLALTRAQFDRAVSTAGDVKGEQAKAIFQKAGEDLGRALERYVERGAVLISKTCAVAYPGNVDITQAVADELHLVLPARSFDAGERGAVLKMVGGTKAEEGE